MLHRLCGPPSIPLSFNLAAVLPRRRAYRVGCGTEALGAPTPSAHRLRRGLPGYLILFAPHAVAPQRQERTSSPPSPPVFFPISTNFTSTLGIPRASSVLQPRRLKRRPRVEPGTFTPDQRGRLRALYAQSFRATLAPFVLPRLLARSWPGLLLRVPSPSSPPKGLYNPKTFFTHAELLGQACAHCPIFPTAASRRSPGRVSVPVWLVVLSDQLPIVALVGRSPANKLIGRRPLQRRIAALGLGPYAVLAPVSRGCPPPSDMFLRVAHPSATPRCRGVRLACVKHSASVRSEPGSNSQVHRARRSEEHTSELQSRQYLVCRLLLEKKKT